MSALNSILQNALAQIDGERKRELERERQRVMTEKVVPQNTAIDVALKNAVDELRKTAEESIQQIRANLDAEVAELTKAAQAKKEQTAQSELASAECLVNAKYNAVVDRVTKMVEEVGD